MTRAKGRALWLADVLRDAGLSIEVEPGWEQRGKDPIEWVAQVNHHTASNRNGGVEPARGTVRDGRPDVPGPLANTLPRRDGTIRIMAAGAANHPGVAYLPLRGGIASGVKYWALGHEIELDGIGEPFEGPQFEAVHRMNAAIAIYLGHNPATQLYDHKSIARPQGRKIDVNPYDLDAGRRLVADLINPAPNPQEGWLMALTDKQQDEIYKWVKEMKGDGVHLHRKDLTRARVNETNGLLVGKGKRLGMFRRNIAAALSGKG